MSKHPNIGGISERWPTTEEITLRTARNWAKGDPLFTAALQKMEAKRNEPLHRAQRAIAGALRNIGNCKLYPIPNHRDTELDRAMVMAAEQILRSYCREQKIGPYEESK